jgi:hypothetical protein
MASNPQSRKWHLVINNPQDCDFTHNKIKEILEKFCVDYYCMADERGSSGTLHTHIFIYSTSPIRFSTLRERFLHLAHIEKGLGTAQQNRDYILKQGEKWENSDKHETIIDGSFEEFGILPDERQEKAPKMSLLLDEIKSDKSTLEIINDNPEFAFKIKDIDLLRQTIKAEKFSKENRNVFVTYLYGATGTGKTSSIYKKYNASDISRITSYGINGKGVLFDEYNYSDVLVFEEFHSQIPINEMLNYLDCYPLFLSARYQNKVACYSQVFITANISLFEQYQKEKINKPTTWDAFWRRIDKIIEFKPDGIREEREDLLWSRRES